MGSQDRELRELLGPVVAAQGADLVEVGLLSAKRRATLRLVIYSRSGVSHGDCARVTRAVGDAVDDAGILAGGYDLEVSSPGLRRVMKEESEFEIFRGSSVRIWLSDGDATREIAGTCEGTRAGDGVVLRTEDGSESVIPWSRVTKARLDAEDAPAEGLGGKGR